MRITSIMRKRIFADLLRLEAEMEHLENDELEEVTSEDVETIAALTESSSADVQDFIKRSSYTDLENLIVKILGFIEVKQALITKEEALTKYASKDLLKELAKRVDG